MVGTRLALIAVLITSMLLSGCHRGTVTKGKPGFWTHRRAFEQVKYGSNIQLLPYSLVSALIAFS
jgi:hypothetical protein